MVVLLQHSINWRQSLRYFTKLNCVIRVDLRNVDDFFLNWNFFGLNSSMVESKKLIYKVESAFMK